jgi:acid phosphatase type 7
MPATNKNQVPPNNVLQPGAVRAPHASKNSRANPGVSPLSAVGNRNMSFQPLPRPLGLPPYHYTLADNFSAIANNIQAAKKMVSHVLGDSGGVQDGEFQNNVAEQMIKQLTPGG